MNNKVVSIIFGLVIMAASAGVAWSGYKSRTQPVSPAPVVSNSVATSTLASNKPSTPSTVTTRPVATPKPVTQPAPTTPAPITPIPVPNSYTMAQVATHASRSSCWTAVEGQVYDLTQWIGEHPGGERAILGLCGKDGTADFNDQHGGQSRPARELASFLLGPLQS